MILMHKGSKNKKPAKFFIRKFVKLTGHNYAYNNLTNFEYVVHAITGNGNYANLLKTCWEKLVKTHQVNLAGF
jgi:hypothetical protein